MIVTDDTDLDKLFHGARQMRNRKQTDDVITASFDPATVNCLVCPDHHNIFKTHSPVAIVMSDQNFLPALSSDISEGEGCLAIVRLEDAGLNDLAELACEIFDKIVINPGSVFLLGSASHLFRASITAYAQDWVSMNANLSKKFKTAHVCPLVPLILEEVASGLARDVEMLAMWLHKVYGTGIRGLGEVWSCVASHAQHFTIGSTLLQYEEVVKVSLPSSLDSPGTETFFFKFRSSSPARLCSMDRKVIFELLQILTHLLKKNFSVNISPEVILPRATPEVVNLAASNHIICVGLSIIQQTVPFIRALGYSVTDLSKLGWLATQDNIDALIKELSALNVPPGFAIVLDLLGNCGHRFVQFDGTLAMPTRGR
jgi:hypothetical protein